MQWLMLQQDGPEDFVIATGRQYSVRGFVTNAAESVGLQLRRKMARLLRVGPYAPVALTGAAEVLAGLCID